jgi:hypothetical protein
VVGEWDPLVTVNVMENTQVTPSSQKRMKKQHRWILQVEEIEQ